MKNTGKAEYQLAKAQNIFWCSIRKVVGRDRFKRNQYYGKPILGIEDANRVIYDALQADKPFLAARFGDAELRALVYAMENELGLRQGYPKYIQTVMQRNAGFFPANPEHLTQFGQLLWESSKAVDVFAVWFNLLEDFVIRKTTPDAKLVELVGLEPYRSKQPWSRALKGRKVLVVHPFEESIRHQYAIHDRLFADPNVLPDFNLLTYKAVQTNAGGTCEYATWFDALDAMFTDIQKLDFDVAIVGCGAYGLPLAAKIKGMGKQVIHLAGATQILFGIRGARWDARPEMQQYFNENWIRPGESERPKDANSVEGGCYW